MGQLLIEERMKKSQPALLKRFLGSFSSRRVKRLHSPARVVRTSGDLTKSSISRFDRKEVKEHSLENAKNPEFDKNCEDPKPKTNQNGNNSEIFKFLRIWILSPIQFDLRKLVKNKKKLEGIQRVIIHFHGGGFICMSSQSHQVYLRKYCNKLNSIIFSVDYPLAPQSKYPDLIECCIKAYLYITGLIQKVLKLENYNLVLTGDSAGGNICLAILNWLIMNQIPLPKGLLLCYPVCNLDDSVFTPSQIHVLKDYIFSALKLKLCYECYLDASSDPRRDFMLR